MASNFSNNKLNENTTTATGLEAVLDKICKFIVDVNGSTNGIIYGKFSLKPNEGNFIKRALDKGILNLLDLFISVDFCNLINYSINSIPGGKPFNPSDPVPDNFFLKTKYGLQKSAFFIQKNIDQYYSSYSNTFNSNSNLGLITLITEINNNLSTSFSAIQDLELKDEFKQLSILKPTLEDIFQYFKKFEQRNSLSLEEFKKIQKTVDKVRTISITIQSLSSAAGLVSAISNFDNGQLNKQIEKLNKEIGKEVSSGKALALLKSILGTCNNIVSVSNKIIGYIETSRVVIKLCVLLIKVFTAIKAFIAALPIPNTFTTAGITTVISNKYEELLTRKGTDKLLKRLEQVSSIINLIAIVCTSIVVAIQQIIQKLNILLLNLENCNSLDPSIKEDVSNTIQNLTQSAQKLQKFLDQYNSADQKINRQYGKYTIEIVSEELADEGVSIKRRYGIARSPEGYVVVTSSPTFASLDEIIINEVKLLLSSGGYVSFGINALSPEDISLITQVLKYLDEEGISIEDIESTFPNLQSAIESDSELQLGKFVENLPGGRDLKKRVRNLLIKNNRNLVNDLKNTDPGSKYSQSIIKQTESENIQLKIQDLQEERQRLIASTLSGNPVSISVATSRIAEIDREIKKLKNG